jgi:5-methyltetrahydropteroyltriglutamate--homocysteine methyltransferase
MRFRAKPAAVVEGPLTAGSLDLLADCQRAADVAGGPFKFTITSPYMLARTLLDVYYRDFDALLMAVADVLASQVKDLPCACIQVDEANIPGNPSDAPRAARAINRVLDAITPGTTRAVHFCFGNYGGQVIQQGTWAALTEFLNSLHADHLVLELAHRPAEDLQALANIEHRIELGLGVIDIKVNHVETADEVARRIEGAARVLGPPRIRYVHPDCGFWMLKRSVADRKIVALVQGRDLFEGRRKS